jgi:restriction system protein
VGRRRRRNNDAPLLDALFELFTATPAWVGPLVAVLAFAFLRYLVPMMFAATSGSPDTGVIMRPVVSLLAWVAGAGILLAWIAAEFGKRKQRRLLDRQHGIDTVRALPWREFEQLVCEAYRRQGYLAQTVGSAGGDGGVDVELRGHGETVLVQCKQWKAYTVGVQIARELLGVVVSRGATRGILVTSGRFTRGAERFAAGNPRIELVDGPALAELIASVRHEPRHAHPTAAQQIGSQPAALQPAPSQPTPASPAAPSPSTPAPLAAPACPTCGGGMVMRQAKRGPQAGTSFWGCPRYPTCRGTRPAT